MQAVLSDMALHVEATVALVMRLCRSFDRAPDDAREAGYMRLLTPAIKYWVCKSAPGFLYEAMECLGGNGYVEEGILARHYREAPVNAIWEGSGNVMCLDVLRALSREADAALAVFHDLAGGNAGPLRRHRGDRLHRQGPPPAGWRTHGAPGGRKTGAAGGGRRAQCRVATAGRIVRGNASCGESRQHVRRGRTGRAKTSAVCSNGRCREYRSAVMPGHDEARMVQPMKVNLMDSLTPTSSVASPADDPRPAAAADLEVLGHRAVGPVHLRRDVRWPGHRHRLFRVAARLVRYRRGHPRRRRRADDLALGHHGIAGGAAGGLDRDPSDAHALCRLSRAALDLMAQFRRSASQRSPCWSAAGTCCRAGSGAR